jgi:hypothetical protein
MAPQAVKSPKKPGVKGSKKKKQSLKFHIECKNPVEDGIMNAGDFVSVGNRPAANHISF